MTIRKETEGNSAVLTLSGRLDTTTAPELEAAISELGDDITDLTMDFGELQYISSAGLRVLLTTQKHFNAIGGTMQLRNVGEEILDVFDMTGFDSFLTII